MRIEELVKKNVQKLLRSIVHAAIVLPPHAVHYMLIEDGEYERISLGGEKLLETDGIHANGFKLTTNADFITLYRSYLPIIPLAIQEHRILKLGSLTALLQLIRQYPTPNVILQTDATEGHWQLNQSDDETSLELL